MNTKNKNRVSLLTACALLSAGFQSIFAETGMREPMDTMDTTEVRTMDYAGPEDRGSYDVVGSNVMEEETPRREGFLRRVVKAPGRASRHVAGGVTGKNRRNRTTTTESTQRRTSKKGGEAKNKETRKMSKRSCASCPSNMKKGMGKRSREERTMRTDERSGY
jgi:hypothetical protein